MKLKFYPLQFISILCLGISLSVTCIGQPKFSTTKINEKVFVITEIWEGNNNGNVGIVIGDDGVLLINTLMKSTAPYLEAEIKKITDKPVKYIINSDSDPFNHHANEYFYNKGATIYAHENIKYSTAFTHVLFKDKISIPFGDEIISAYHTPAHTLDHIDIFLEKSNVLFMSDAFKNHWLTYTGPNGLKGLINGLDKALTLSNDHTKIVSGNTSKNPEKYVSTKRDLVSIKKMHLAFTDRVVQLNKKGVKAKEIAKDKKINNIIKPLEAYPAFGQYSIDLIYELLETEITPSIQLTMNQLMSYVGTYQLSEANNNIEIVLNDEKLYARQEGRFLFELTPITKTKFDFKAATDQDYLIFESSKNGKCISLSPELEQNGWWANIIKSGVYNKKTEVKGK